MKIPFGNKLPTGEVEQVLQHAGFIIKHTQKIGDLYYLTLPASKNIKCKYGWENMKNDRECHLMEVDFYYKIYFNNVIFMEVIQKIRDKENSTCYQKTMSFFQAQTIGISVAIYEDNLYEELPNTPYAPIELNHADTANALESQLTEVIFGTIKDGGGLEMNTNNLLIQYFPHLLSDIQALIIENPEALKKHHNLQFALPAIQGKRDTDDDKIFKDHSSDNSCRIC